MSEKRRMQRFNLDEGRIWEAIEGLSPFRTTYALEEVCEKLNEQQSFISDLLKENEEYKKESEDMQIKINVLYHEAKKHMSSTEWERFNRRIIEREEELGIKWVRI